MSFDSILGQERAVSALRSLLASRRAPNALLFHGPAGVGKATAALELALALNCERPLPGGEGACGGCPSCAAGLGGSDLDLKRINAAYQAGLRGEEAEKQQHVRIDTLRFAVRDMEMRSLSGRWKAAIIEEAHTLLEDAANALLKSLEEPPPRSVWILVTSRRDALLPTVRSRCHAVRFRALHPAVLRRVLEARQVPASEAAALAAASEGSPGRALELRARGLPDPGRWLGDPLAGLRLAESLPRELPQARAAASDHLRLMAWRLRQELGDEALSEPRARRALRALHLLRRGIEDNADPRLILELAALEMEEAGVR